MGTILMKDPPRHCCPHSCFSQEKFCKGGLGVMSGGKHILNVLEKSCVSGYLQSVCMEMGSFRVEFSEEKNLFCFLCISFPLLFSPFCPLFFYHHYFCAWSHVFAFITSYVCFPFI